MNDISGEDSIVWLEDPAGFPYVRETYLGASFRSRKPKFGLDGRMVGYATLRADVRGSVPGFFDRRVFWVKRYDRSEDPDGTYAVGAPAEAVDPLTVAPGVAGSFPAGSGA